MVKEVLGGIAGYVVVTDVPKEHLNSQAAHDSYVSLQKVERDFRQLQTGLLEVRPVWVRIETRTRGHVFCCMLALKLGRELEQRLHAAFGTTESARHHDPHALAALSRRATFNLFLKVSLDCLHPTSAHRAIAAS